MALKYTTKDRTPYTYLIGWSKLDKYYYGKRTAKKCHPTDLWVKYFTSSKEVPKMIEIYGDPDVIKIRKVFTSIELCCLWETRFLNKVNAAKNIKFINKHNNPKHFDMTEKTVILIQGESVLIEVANPIFKTKSYITHNTGKVSAISKDGTKAFMFTKDIRYTSGEFIAASKGRRYSDEVNKTKGSCFNLVAVREVASGKCFRVEKTDPRLITKEVIPVGSGAIRSNSFKKLVSERKKGKVSVIDMHGNKFDVELTDSRYLSGEVWQTTKGTVMAKDNSTGKIFRTKKDDIRFLTGEIINPNFGKKYKQAKKREPLEKLTCSYCKKEVGKNMINRFHNENCKVKLQLSNETKC